jgi:hypothetical protein
MGRLTSSRFSKTTSPSRLFFSFSEKYLNSSPPVAAVEIAPAISKGLREGWETGEQRG